jgi:CRISPR-associated protein Csm2
MTPKGGSLSRDDVQDIIRKGGRALVDAAEDLGPRLKRNRLTTNQIRNVYGMVKKMELQVGSLDFDFDALILLKPKLAYAAARADNDGARELKNVLSWAIDEVGTNRKHFERLVDFFEAILAYHKAAGGR